MATGNLEKRPDHILDPLAAFLTKRHRTRAEYVHSMSADANARYEVGYMTYYCIPKEVRYTSPERITWYVVTPNGYMGWCSRELNTIQKDETCFFRDTFDPLGMGMPGPLDPS